MWQATFICSIIVVRIFQTSCLGIKETQHFFFTANPWMPHHVSSRMISLDCAQTTPSTETSLGYEVILYIKNAAAASYDRMHPNTRMRAIQRRILPLFLPPHPVLAYPKTITTNHTRETWTKGNYTLNMQTVFTINGLPLILTSRVGLWRSLRPFLSVEIPLATAILLNPTVLGDLGSGTYCRLIYYFVYLFFFVVLFFRSFYVLIICFFVYPPLS